MILNVYKNKNMTSRDVVNIISKHFNTKKVGHTGTLDPIAQGVLIVCLDKDTKLVDVILSDKKEYIAEIKLGIETDTLDITGNVVNTKLYDNITYDKVNNVLKSFIGESIQEVPLYSAIKIKGKKLYEYARNKEDVKLPKRSIYVYDIELIEYKDDYIKFRVVVSKGTYIRSLIKDICKKLNTVGTMSDLIRSKQGKFRVEDSNRIEDILNDNYKVISKDELFSDVKKVMLDESLFKKVDNGVPINFNYQDDLLYLVYNNKAIALYKKYNDIYKMYKKF
jgi:tRNA pseudouridine55 synthase